MCTMYIHTVSVLYMVHTKKSIYLNVLEITIDNIYIVSIALFVGFS